VLFKLCGSSFGKGKAAEFLQDGTVRYPLDAGKDLNTEVTKMK
jgi:hypothetical protein